MSESELEQVQEQEQELQGLEEEKEEYEQTSRPRIAVSEAPQLLLVWRRIVLLHSASAKAYTMARNWGVVIVGRVGKNSYQVLEPYSLYEEANNRVTAVNKAKEAVVMSIEEILFPSGYPVLRYIPKDLPLDSRIPGVSIPLDRTQEEQDRFYPNKQDLQIIGN